MSVIERGKTLRMWLIVGGIIFMIMGVVYLNRDEEVTQLVPDYLVDDVVSSTVYLYRDYQGGVVDRDKIRDVDGIINEIESTEQVQDLFENYLYNKNTYMLDVVGSDDVEKDFFESFAGYISDDESKNKELMDDWENRILGVEKKLGVEFSDTQVVTLEVARKRDSFEQLDELIKSFSSELYSFSPSFYSVHISEGTKDGYMRVRFVGSWIN